MLNYITKNNGINQIIFIHGNSMSAKSWEAVMNSETLNNYTLTAIDLPGHGQSFKSENPDKDYSLRGLAQHTADFIKQFENNPYIIVVNSLGGNVIGEIVLQLQNCKGLMLVGSSAVGMGLGADKIIMPNPNMETYFRETFTEEQLNTLIEDCAYNLSNEKKKRVYTIFANTDPKVRSSIAKCVVEQDYSNELQNLADAKLPLAWVYGKEEKLCFTDALNIPAIPKWRDKIILLEQSRHCSQLDQPQKLAQLVSEFAKDCF